ncbi:MAG: hypothetical protein ACTSXH_02550 [Promethearchaeota archaeon]|nr:hypothetical protein [bacterium]
MMQSKSEILNSLGEMFGVISFNGTYKLGHVRMTVDINGEVLFSIPTPAAKAARLIKWNRLSGEMILLYLMNICTLNQGTAMKIDIDSDTIKTFDYVKVNFLDIAKRNMKISEDYRTKIEETVNNKKIVKGLKGIGYELYKIPFLK